MNKAHFRKVAAHHIKFADGRAASFSVVTIEGVRVVDIHPLKSEEASTEWLPGTIFIDIDKQAIPHALYEGQYLTALG